MESVTGFVQRCHYVLMDADGVDKDERFADGGVGSAICTRGLVLAVRQVGQLFGQQGIEITA